MPYAFAAWLAASAGTATNVPQAMPQPVSPAVLPSGSSEAFHERMVGWSAEPEARPLIATERLTQGTSPRLGRLAITSRFGWRSDPITGLSRRHAGVDLPSRFGAAVKSTAPGVVRIAGWAGGYGNLVEIEHSGGVRTRYGHLSRIDVFPSEHVEAGQLIGEVGSTGRSTGPHLHYEVRIAGLPVDPLSFVGQRAEMFQTVWGNERHATPKWEWNGAFANRLPEASLR